MKRDETVYLRHIVDAITKVETYLQDIDEITFKQNSLIQDGVIRQIEVIGEATCMEANHESSAHSVTRIGDLCNVVLSK